MDIGAWLAELGLEQYRAAFEENAIDAEVLPELTEEDLRELGVGAIGHRRKILAAIRRLGAAEGGAPSPRDAGEVSQAQQGERRHVAVLFADLVGYTRLTEELGAEAMHDLLDRYFRWLDGIIERGGGRVDKHIGDCVMGVFGAPVSHGNDAERAVRAALEIRKTIADFRAEAGYDIQVHVGLSIGVVVASYVGEGRTAEYAVTGESVNLASRLGDAAGADEILISDGLHRALEGRLDCEAAGELAVKGFADPVPAWRLIGLEEGPGAAGPFVGRLSELRQFDTLLASCLDDGIGQVAVIRGEAGIGKTRLGEEFERMAREKGFACHRALVLDFGVETGRDALRSIIRDLLGIEGRVSQEGLRAAALAAIEKGIVAPEQEVHLNALLDLPQQDSLRAAYDAMDNECRTEGRGEVISRILSWASGLQPRLLIIEDLHWAKPPLLRSLAQLASAVGGCRAVVTLSTRPEGDPLDRAWRSAAPETAFTTFDLNPLASKDAIALCEASLGSGQEVKEMITRAGGNPLFLRQLLAHAQAGDSQSVPGTVQSLVQASVDQLSAGDKRLIQAASVVGQRVAPDLLEALCDVQPLDLSGLVERNLLRPQGEDYLFVHALIRDAVYESLLGQRKRQLHLRAADWFAGRDYRLHAEHLALGGAEEAAGAFLAAAREEVAKYHYETALSLIERGLALAASPGDLFALRLLEGETQHDFGGMKEAAAAYEQALELAPDDTERCRVLIGQAAVKRIIEENDSALSDLEAAQALAEAEELGEERSKIHFLRGNLLFPRGDIEGCLREHSEALRIARSIGRPDLQAAALGGLGDAEYARGHMASARQRLEECVALAREQGLPRVAVANEAQIAHTLIYTDAQGQALEKARAAAEAAQRIGHARAELNARVAWVKALHSMQRYEECAEECGRCYELIDRLGTLRFRQLLYLHGGIALRGLGRRAEAARYLDEAMEVARQTGFAFQGPSVASGLAVLAEEGAEKRELLRQAEEGLAAGCVGHNQFRVYADGIDVAFSLRDASLLERYSELAQGYPEGEEVTWSLYHGKRGRALLGLLREGRNERTLEALRAVEKQTEDLQMWAWSVASHLNPT